MFIKSFYSFITSFILTSFIFVLTQKRNKKVKAENLFTKNCFISRKILKTRWAKIFYTFYSTILLT